MLFPKGTQLKTTLNDDDVILIGDSADIFKVKKVQAKKFVSNGTTPTNEEVVVLPTFQDFPQPGQPNTVYIEEEFDVAYYWDGEFYREFTSSDDLIVIRSLADLDQYTTAGLFRVKFITRTRTRRTRTVVENFMLNVTRKQKPVPNTGELSQSFENRDGYQLRKGTYGVSAHTWDPWENFIYSFKKTLIEHKAIEGSVFDIDIFENEYHKFEIPLTSLTLNNIGVHVPESVFDFTAATDFVFQTTAIENLYANEILSGDRVIVTVRMGVMEIRKVITGGGGNRSYTLDFQMSAELVQDLNILGPIKIAKIKAKNCAKVFLSYTDVTRLEITPDVDLELLIADGELLMWEIQRTTEDTLASVAVLITI